MLKFLLPTAEELILHILARDAAQVVKPRSLQKSGVELGALITDFLSKF
jgi:hypothetical protein